jgi:hypothetical protein
MALHEQSIGATNELPKVLPAWWSARASLPRRIRRSAAVRLGMPECIPSLCPADRATL